MKQILSLLLLFFAASLHSQDKQKFLWFDATANFERLSFKDSISFYLDKTKSLGFTDVVVDVKPITGEVLYNSEIAPQMKEWNNYGRDSSFNFLEFFIDESHDRNLKVHASLNVFVAGHNFFNRGVVYNSKPEWQSINYTDSGMVPITKLNHKYSAMLNPALQEVQKYEISILQELVEKYPSLDGIILDRVRYDCIEADFSNESKILFENYINQNIETFPGDIFEWKKNSTGKSSRVEGKHYKKWIEWRASVIYNFIKKARQAVKTINPDISFGDYAGAWYPLYYEVGVNWASNKYNPAKDFDWATSDYKNFGYAELLDLFLSGNYFYEVTKDEVEKLNEVKVNRAEAAMGKGKEYWYSVEGSAEIADSVVMNAAPIIGGLYVEQYKDHPEQFILAIKMCLKKTNGVMIFDIVHIINNNWWDEIEF
ncbi:MAG: family 10 glycosylhydrolase [Ignavibacteriaceae bacterium]|nr:family 10 glycosylhydrolase [Ignavibacteriaceae bacterium]